MKTVRDKWCAAIRNWMNRMSGMDLGGVLVAPRLVMNVHMDVTEYFYNIYYVPANVPAKNMLNKKTFVSVCHCIKHPLVFILALVSYWLMLIVAPSTLGTGDFFIFSFIF